MQWHLKSRKKITGAKKGKSKKKHKRERGRDYIPTRLDNKKTKKIRTRGGSEKNILFSNNIVIVSDKNKVQKTKILSVLENPANPQFVRRNIITKGAIIETEMGKARVTSRPGQHGSINAVLISDKK